MSDHIADTNETAGLLALHDKVQKLFHEFYLELGVFDRHLDALKEMAENPPPHPDPAAFRAHIASRITETKEAIEKMRALVPPGLRMKSRSAD